MINVKDHKTGYLIDPWDHLGPKLRQLLEKSWAGMFRAHLLEHLPITKLIPFFHSGMGRPTKELFVMMGAILLQQIFDLTDEELQAAVAFDTRYRFALDIIEHSDEACYISERSIWTYRQIIVDNSLDGLIFESLTDTLIDAFNVATDKQRLDSTHIQSNMRKLSRMKIFTKTIKKFLTNLKRQHPQQLQEYISAEMQDQYLSKKGYGCFSQVKPTEAQQILGSVSKEMLHLVQLFKDDTIIRRLNSYTLMERILHEHCIITESDDNDDDPSIELKKNKDVPSNSLQNPSDPDAAYSGHKGQGFSAQIMETYTINDDKEKDKDPPLDLITYVEVTPANIGDSASLIPAILSTEKRKCKPKDVSVDTAYGGDKNVEDAKGHHVTVIAPAHCSDGQNGTYGLKDFQLNSKEKTLQLCPQGHAALENHRTRTGRTATTFDRTICTACPDKEICPVIINKTQAVIYYDAKQMRLAQRRQYEQTDEFIDRYRWRAGIEGTNARLKQQTGAARLRVRGLKRVRFAIKLKALGINIFRATKVHARKARKTFANVQYGQIGVYWGIFSDKMNEIFRTEFIAQFWGKLSAA